MPATPARLLSTLLLALLALAPAAAAKAQDAPTLLPQWDAGQSARYATWSREVSRTVLTAQGESQSLTTTIETESEQTWTVESVEADGTSVCKLETHFIEATLTLDAEGNPDGPQTITLSSRNPTGDIEAYDQLVKAMVDHPLTYRVAPDGSIQSVTGGQQIRDALGEFAELASDDDELMQQAEAMATLPGVPTGLALGGTWIDNDTNTTQVPVVPQMLELPGTITSAVTFTYEDHGEIEGIPVATVSSQTRSELEVDTSELPAQLPVAVQLVESTGEGETIVDLSRHEIVASHGQSRRVVRATLTGPDGQTLTSETTTTSQGQSLRIAEDE
ncbi:MAG: hypothetical protein ACIAXF_07600 [Phycisphaerales bacterium JB063]